MPVWFRHREPQAPPAWCIVGLGNPGAEYAHTRHNAGFEVVDILCSRHHIRLNVRRDYARYGFGTIANTPVLLAKPMLYMNRSGEAARAIMQRYGLNASSLLVIVDDVALALGRIRVRPSGSDGGHNGLASVVQCIGAQQFPRIRIGIGSPPPGQMVEYVLSPFEPEERVVAEKAFQQAADAVETAIAEGVQAAMNRYNTRSTAPDDQG